ncbi:MAG: hypothetical protein H8D61_01940 [Deltaproteobacteria bacterium]|nr:hypothetical protein [Deltaproteobacteria bacterium]
MEFLIIARSTDERQNVPGILTSTSSVESLQGTFKNVSRKAGFKTEKGEIFNSDGRKGDKMATQKILLPYNFTNYDQKALDFVVRTFVHLKDVEVSLFHTYTPVPEIEMRESPVMYKLKDSLNYLSQRIKEQEAALNVAKHNLAPHTNLWVDI